MFHIHNLEEHGAGAYYSLTIGKNPNYGKRVRFSIGAYGNIPAPMGSFTWYPKTQHYPNVLHITFLNMAISFLQR